MKYQKFDKQNIELNINKREKANQLLGVLDHYLTLVRFKSGYFVLKKIR